MIEILDLQRGPHANDVARCEEYTFGIRTLLLALVFASERETRSSLNAGSLLTHTFGTATLRVGVLAVGMRIRVMHGIAGSIGVSKFFLAF